MGAAGQALAEMSGHSIEVVATEVARDRPSRRRRRGRRRRDRGDLPGHPGLVDGHALLVLQPDGAWLPPRPAARRLRRARHGRDRRVRPPREPRRAQLSALREWATSRSARSSARWERHLEAVVVTVPVAVSDMAGAILDGVLADLPSRER
ncbi:MAG: hypothetical protein U0838_06005 [Chloroflexota bacterium]